MDYKTPQHRRLYAVWDGMIRRCTNPSHKQYADYGGRGIKVCERWMNYDNWLEDIPEMPDGMSMERIDNNGDYSPENVILADRRTQARNRRSNRPLEYKGETKLLIEWAEEKNIKMKTLWMRISHYGWSVEDALERPVRGFGL